MPNDNVIRYLTVASEITEAQTDEPENWCDEHRSLYGVIDYELSSGGTAEIQTWTYSREAGALKGEVITCSEGSNSETIFTGGRTFSATVTAISGTITVRCGFLRKING